MFTRNASKIEIVWVVRTQASARRQKILSLAFMHGSVMCSRAILSILKKRQHICLEFMTEELLRTSEMPRLKNCWVCEISSRPRAGFRTFKGGNHNERWRRDLF